MKSIWKEGINPEIQVDSLNFEYPKFDDHFNYKSNRNNLLQYSVWLVESVCFHTTVLIRRILRWVNIFHISNGNISMNNSSKLIGHT